MLVVVVVPVIELPADVHKPVFIIVWRMALPPLATVATHPSLIAVVASKLVTLYREPAFFISTSVLRP